MLNAILNRKKDKLAFHFPDETTARSIEYFMLKIGYDNRKFALDNQSNAEKLFELGYQTIIVFIESNDTGLGSGSMYKVFEYEND